MMLTKRQLVMAALIDAMKFRAGLADAWNGSATAEGREALRRADEYEALLDSMRAGVGLSIPSLSGKRRQT